MNKQSISLANLIPDLILNIAPENYLVESLSLNDEVITLKNTKLNLGDFNAIHLLSIGKSAANEMQVLNRILEPIKHLHQKLAYTKDGHSIEGATFKQIEGSHPYLEARNLEQTEKCIHFLSNVGSDDLIIFSISGGASALLEKFPTAFKLEDIASVYDVLLQSGKSIEVMNEIRKSLSLVKNGGFLKSCSAKKIVVLYSSDVPSGELKTIGSSPLYYESLNSNEILKLVQEIKFEDSLSRKLTDWLTSSDFKELSEMKRLKQNSLKPIYLKTADAEYLGTKAKGLFQKHFPNKLFSKDFPVYDSAIEKVIDAEIKRIKGDSKSRIFLSGGEATFKLPKDHGKGGRNTHFVALMADKIWNQNCFELSTDELQNIEIISFASDGTDGPTDSAGAFLNFQKYVEIKDDLLHSLNLYDTYNLFDQTNCLFKTGPTGVNFMDLHVICLGERCE